jgi:TldD protein
VSGETTAFAHANELSEAAIRRAAETMTVLDPGKGPRGRRRARTNQALYTDADPLSLIPFADKVALCQQIDAAARARDPRVAQVSVSLAGELERDRDRPRRRLRRHDVRPLVRLNVQIVVEQNGRRETGYHGLGGRYLYDACSSPRPGTARSTSRSRRRW